MGSPDNVSSGYRFFIDVLERARARNQGIVDRLQGQLTPELIGGLPPPSYTQLEGANKSLVALSGLVDPNTMPQLRGFLDSPQGNIDVLKSDPLDLGRVETFLSGLLDVSVPLYFSDDPFGDFVARLAIHAGLATVGAVAMLPDQLIPRLEIHSGEGDRHETAAEFSISEFKIRFFAVRNRPGNIILINLLHEIWHVLQLMRGVQFGGGINRLEDISPNIIGSIRLYFPALQERDEMFDHATFFYNMDANYTLSVADLTKLINDVVGGLTDEKIELLAKAIGITVDGLSRFDLEPLILREVFENAANEVFLDRTTGAISEPMVAQAFRILCRAATLISMGKPEEIEAYFAGRLDVGNPFATIDDGKDRGLIQMPVLASEREALYRRLQEAATQRRRQLVESKDVLGARYLLGGPNYGIPVGATAITDLSRFPGLEGVERHQVGELIRRQHEMLDARTGRVIEMIGRAQVRAGARVR